MTNDIALALQVIGKIFSGMFLTSEGLSVLVVFLVAGLAFWIKTRMES